MAVIGAVVLGIEGSGTRAGVPQHAAGAVAVGFAAAAGAFALALVAGWFLLSPEPVTEDVDPADVLPG